MICLGCTKMSKDETTGITDVDWLEAMVCELEKVEAERENLRATMQKVLDALDHDGAASGWGVVRDWMRETLAELDK